MMLDGSITPQVSPQGILCEMLPVQQVRLPRIGLFDSGVGGLSVLSRLQAAMPWLDYIYCGDTARLPYGKRSPATIIEYSLQASRFLVQSGADCIVIACNTASSVALGAVQQAFPDIVVRGVVDAGARAAAQASRSGRVGLIGTECTVASRAYEKAIAQILPAAEVRSRACPFLVSLAEEGWTQDHIAAMAVRKYIEPLLADFAPYNPDCIICGCTHFSRFSTVIRDIVSPDVVLVDPADSLAEELAANFSLQFGEEEHNNGSTTFYVTDALQRFARVGEQFLGASIPFNSVQQIELDNQ
ncbi:glutamate racemase [Desulfovibrio mangrovi]|uniref:glutamate racemase n=1 Tax=Desulfovibrio mangrovi TaxID=2976983 RepID=UPI002246E9DD|nr:glutamate racemase [Desulfovibrio mangrovi]UZP68775.1 glutamate racemase [Desulfovibrio mangrovi]